MGQIIFGNVKSGVLVVIEDKEKMKVEWLQKEIVRPNFTV